ncbi:MAG: hypothetical protein CMK89_12780 [Pseudomonadales bacterium]|nr:hypothetical protein [Pseudomonadales bacterium]
MKALMTSLCLGFCLLLTACQEENPTTILTPQEFTRSDECHLCGMAILGFPGPKGQALVGRPAQVVKFCSTRDLISWYLQPENIPNTKALFVHDMARSDWQHPDDRHLIDAREAWYVVGSSQRGAMGPTLASFATEESAKSFANQQGGNVLSFYELRLDQL